MNYAIRHRESGKWNMWEVISEEGFKLLLDEQPFVFDSIGKAKAAITRGLKYSYATEDFKLFCLDLEIVEVRLHFSVGEVVFNQIFRTDKM